MTTRRYDTNRRHLGERSMEEIHQQNERVRRERGHDIPTTCAACGMALADVCAWHPHEVCAEFQRSKGTVNANS